MQITILILVYIVFFCDIMDVVSEKGSNLLLTGALVTLLSWEVSTPWGIVMCCVSSVLVLYAIVKE